MDLFHSPSIFITLLKKYQMMPWALRMAWAIKAEPT